LGAQFSVNYILAAFIHVHFARANLTKGEGKWLCRILNHLYEAYVTVPIHNYVYVPVHNYVYVPLYNYVYVTLHNYVMIPLINYLAIPLINYLMIPSINYLMMTALRLAARAVDCSIGSACLASSCTVNVVCYAIGLAVQGVQLALIASQFPIATVFFAHQLVLFSLIHLSLAMKSQRVSRAMHGLSFGVFVWNPCYITFFVCVVMWACPVCCCLIATKW
jgi:hypothetical protein